MDMLVDVPRIKRGIGGEPFRSVTNAGLGRRDKRKEITTVVLLEGARFFRDDKFTMRRVAGHGNTGTLAPQVFFLFGFGLAGRTRRRGNRLTLIMAFFHPQFAVGIAFGLARWVKAMRDVFARVVLPDPGVNVLHIHRYGVSRIGNLIA